MRSIPAIEVPPNFITIRATAVASCRMGKTRCLIGGRRGDGKGLGAGLIRAQTPHCLISGGESGFGQRSGASRALGPTLVEERKCGVEGKLVSVRLDLVWCRTFQKTKI